MRHIYTFSLALLFWIPVDAQQRFVYVSDAGNFNQPPWQILKFDEDGQNGEVFISSNLAWPQDIVFLEDKNEVLISNLNTGRISRFNATTGAYINEFATGLGGPTRMKIGRDGLLYVLQWSGNGNVMRYQLDGTSAGAFTNVGVSNSIGLDWDALGNLYVSSYNTGTVRKFSPAGADLGDFINANLNGPTNIWFASNGDLIVVDYNDGSVKRFDTGGNYIGFFVADLPQGEGVDFLPNGDILLGSGGLSSVRIYDASGNFKKDLVPPGTLNLMTPNAVVIREATTSVSSIPRYQEIVIATPTVGTRFRIQSEWHTTGSLDVHNTEGVLVQTISAADSTTWDASHLAAGVYVLTLAMGDGVVGRQEIVVQH